MASRAIRIGGLVVGGLLVLIVAGVVIVVATFDPNSYKPRIIAAVKQATGRDLVLQGQIHLGLSLQPTLTVQGVSLSNPPGFSRPELATLQELDLKLALLPLLSRRVEIDRLVLIKPDILLEMNAQGQPNWTFKSQGGPASAPATAPSGSEPSSQTQINVAQ